MTKKEKLEDRKKLEEIDVKEINFKKNQDRIKKLNDRIKREKRLYNTLYILVAIAIILALFVVLKSSSKNAYKSCVENGMSAEWCEVHVQ